MALNIDAKFEGKLTFAFKNDEQFGKFSPEHLKTSKFRLWWDCFKSKVENVWAENLQGSYLPWQWKKMQNWKRNWLVVSKLRWGPWWILTRALENLKNLMGTLMGCLWPKYTTFELNKVKRSYISWQSRLMQHLIENWLVLSQMTWGIQEIFTRTLESLKIGTLMGSFYPK